MKNTKQLFRVKFGFVFLIIFAITLSGCGKKTVTRDEMNLQKIAKLNGWQIENVEARDRVWNAFDSNQEPAKKDIQRLIKAGDTEQGGFDLSLAIVFVRHMKEEYRAPVLKWCERNMAQTNDEYAAVLGYSCYARGGGGDQESWAQQLKARGPFYVEKIDDIDKKEAARKQP